MKRMIKKICYMVLALLLFGGVAGYAESESQNVSLRMAWYPNERYAPFLLGIEKGYFNEEGISIEMVPGKGSTISTKLVATKENDFGLASASTTLAARIKGMPLSVLAVLYQKTSVAVFSLKESGITKPADLKGKTIAATLTSTTYRQFEAFLKKNGMSVDDVEIMPVQGGEIKYTMDGTSDANLFFGYRGEILMKEKGFDYNVMYFADHGLHMYCESIIAHDETVQNDSDLCKRFVRASLKSWQYAIEHPEEARDAYVAKYPEKDAHVELLKIKGMIPFLKSDVTEREGLGYQTTEGWTAVQDVLVQTGLIEKEIEVSTLFTNDMR